MTVRALRAHLIREIPGRRAAATPEADGRLAVPGLLAEDWPPATDRAVAALPGRQRQGGPKAHGDRFEDLATFTAATGAPILADNLGWLDCRVVAAHPAGNHTIFIGEVAAAGPGAAGQVLGDDGMGTASTAGAVRPLLYFNRDYRNMA